MARRRAGVVNVKLLVILLVVVALLGAGGVAGHYERKNAVARRALEQGEAARAAGAWKDACRHLKTYLQKYPDDARVLEWYGDAQLEQRPLQPEHLGAAIGAYRRLIRVDPQHLRAYRQLGTLYTATANFTELAHVAQLRLNRAPDDAEAGLWLAAAYAAQRRHNDARTTLLDLVQRLETADTQRESYIDACLQLGRLAALGGSEAEQAEALRWLDKAVAAGDPPPARALVERARFYRTSPATVRGKHYEEQLTQARRDLEAADAAQPTDPRLRLMLSQEWMAHGDHDQAVAQLATTEQLTEQDLRAYFLRREDWDVLKTVQLIDLALWTGDYADALAPAEEVLNRLEQRTQRVALLPALIELYATAGRVEQAAQRLREFHDLMLLTDPGATYGETVALLNALLAHAQGNPYKVIEHLGPFAEREVTRPKLLKLLSDAFLQTRQPQRAARAMAAYLRLRPNDREVAVTLTRQYIDLRDWGAALETARLTAGRWPEDFDARRLLAEAVVRGAAQSARLLGPADVQETEAVLDQLIAERPGSAEVWTLRAALLDLSGKQADAEQLLRRAIAECPDSTLPDLMLARLYAGSGRSDDALSACAAVCARRPEQSAVWRAHSELLESAARLDEARATLATGLERVADAREKQELNVRLALFDLRQGRRSDGVARLTEMAAAAPVDVHVRSLLLDVPEVRADAERAGRLIAELRTLEGDAGLLWRVHQAAVWLHRADEWRVRQQEIEALLQHCVEANPGWPAPVLLLADLHQRLGTRQMLEPICRRALSVNPAAGEIAALYLSILEEQKRFADARKLLDAIEGAAGLGPEHRVNVLLGTGQWDQALEHLQARLAAEPRNLATRVLLARLLYQRLRDADRALAVLADAEPAPAERLTVAQTRAAILRAAERLDEAQRVLDDELDRQPTFEAYVLRARFFAGTGRLEAAEQDYLRARDVAPDAGGDALLGAFYLETGRPDEAVAVWERGLVAQPDNAQLKRRLAPVLIERGHEEDHARADAMLTELLQGSPNDPELLGLRALLLLQEGTLTATREAETLLRRVIEVEPTAVEAHLGLIDLAMRRGDVPGARELAIQARGSNPGEPRLLLARARAELALRNPGLALELARAALRERSSDREACSVFADVALATRSAAVIAEALERVQAALAERQHDELLHRARARLLAGLDRREEALRTLAQYREQAGGAVGAEVLLLIAELRYAEGDLSQARATLDQAAERYPQSLKVLRARVLWHGNQREWDQVAALVADLRLRSLEEIGIAVTAAALLGGSDQPAHAARATELFEQVLAVTPERSDAALGLAGLQFRAGQTERAEALYRTVLAAEPSNARALNDLAWVTATARNDQQAALDLANRGLGVQPDNPNLRDTRAVILERLNRLAEARTDRQQCVTLARTPAEKARALLKLAVLCEKLNDDSCLQDALAQVRGLEALETLLKDELRQDYDGLVQRHGAEARAP